MGIWTCLTCGPVPPEEIRFLAWDSPHGDEHHTCGSAVEYEPPATAPPLPVPDQPRGHP